MVRAERIPIGCSRAQLKASIGSLPNVNSNGLSVHLQESFLMLIAAVFVYEVELADILVACRCHSKQSDGVVAGAR